KDLPLDTALALYAANLAWAGEKGLAAGVKLVIEPLNPRDAPGYLLRTQEQGAGIAAAIGRDRLGLQFDIYHCQIAQGDVTTRLEKLMPAIDHMQLADVPGRHEPGAGATGCSGADRPKSASPAKAEVHLSAAPSPDEWVPAFAGKAVGWSVQST